MSARNTKRGISRRTLLKASAAISVLPASRVFAQSSEPLKIGFLTVLTGPLAAGGKQQEEGAALFLKERNGMRAVLDIILLILQAYIWLLIAAAVLSWLIAFNVVNTHNQVVATIAEFLYRITEPLLRPIRSLLPNLGGIDVSPVILILLILFLENVIIRYIYPNVF